MMLTKFENITQERHINSLERIATALERLTQEWNAEAGSICWYCTPGLSNTTEQKNFHYCPVCGRKLIKED